MVPFDQTKKSIQKLEGYAAKGKLAREVADKKIAALKKKGSTWVARWEVSPGREATKGGFKTRKAAEAYEAQQRAKVAGGDSSPPMYQRATVAEIVAFYLQNRMAGKVSAANVKPHLERAVSLIGHLRLDRIAMDADRILNDYVFNTSAKLYAKLGLSKGTHFNHFVALRAAFRFWVKKKRIVMGDVWNVVEYADPRERRETTTNFDQYARCLAEAQKPGVPEWVVLFFVIAWDYGRRSGEIFLLDWKDVHLRPESRHELPWMRIRTLKQGKVVFDDLPLLQDSYRVLKRLWALQGNPASGRVVPVQRSATTRWVRKVLDAAGCPDLILHDSRRHLSNRDDLSREQRKDLKGQRTDKAHDHYRTEKRKGLEKVALASYDAEMLAELEEVYSGDFREIGGEDADSRENSLEKLVEPRGVEPPSEGFPGTGSDGETSESSESSDSDPDRRGVNPSQFSRLSPSSREISREIGGGA